MLAPVDKKEHKSEGASARPKHEVADIFRRYGADYRSGHKLSPKQHQVMFDIEHCRRSYFGYHIDICDACDYVDQSHNSCRNRHCPKCQGIARRIWVNARLKDLLPIPYYHVVFTLPHLLNPLVGWNRELIYNLLFDCAAETLLQFGRDPKWLGAQIGFYGILHSWGGKLWQHLHLHFIVSGGGLTEDNRWVEAKHKGKFIFPVAALSKVFRGKFVEGLKHAYLKGLLVLPNGLKHLSDRNRFEEWVNALVARNWVVFSKPPFKTPQKVVRYIGRYTHKVAISNRRIISIDKGIVRFAYKDYKDRGRIKECKLRAPEFIRRFLMHVLPNGFHRIRHYGLFANGKSKANAAQIREALGSENEVVPIRKDQLTEDHTGIRCPVCKKGRLIPIMVIHRVGLVVINVLYYNRLSWDTA